ncbi:ribosome hibernation factor-recruiting GTPase MRF [Streptoalloteichus hindustanus]|uniref:GTPase, G3E family n=1 Tax=Streptoalloteichus hindustanus TaxID=2017 RepID=A0A1M5L131_STRHI|nr:GTP-binding protein [Streptoalloteichus hindustanus]SHG58133.1 GTPase, G3E family [Streptoalloteichus hindustanus]
MSDERTPVVLLAGLAGAVLDEVAGAFLRLPGTAVVHHDLREVAQGVVRRRVRWGAPTPAASGPRADHGAAGPAARAGLPVDQWHVLELAHGCVSCTLREDLLPLTHRLSRTPGVDRIVLHLDPALEPEALCWALRHVVVDGETVLERARVEAVVTVVDVGTWLADATGDETLAERGLLASADDDRTVAQVCVGQVEFADVLVLAGAAPDAWAAERVAAVLDRLAPGAPRVPLARLDLAALLARVPRDARRGELADAHAPLLRGQPPLDPDCGVSTVVFTERRPFHPQRLHEAVDVLLDGVVRARGRVWVASQPDVALWLESAGGGLRVGHAGPWLAALEAAGGPDPWAGVDPQRRAMAALRWDPYYGDRDQEVVVIAHHADPGEIDAVLRHALLTDAELAEGEEAWRSWPDPFGEWHSDPCEDVDRDSDGDGDREGVGVDPGRDTAPWNTAPTNTAAKKADPRKTDPRKTEEK